MSINNDLKIIAEKGKQELFVIREFDAPPELVFEAFTNPDILVHWLGPHGMTMEIDYYHSHTGGSYRYIHIDHEGNSYAFRGVIHEMTAPIRVIQTFEYEASLLKGQVSLDTLQFEPLPNERCKMRIHSIFRTVGDRDGMILAGMARGMQEGFEKLDNILIHKQSQSNQHK